MGQPQQVLLSFVMPDNTTGRVFLDASLNEQHGVQAQITDHQVESGPNITDYIRPMPRRLSITGIVSNTPLSQPQSQTRGFISSPQNFQSDSANWTALGFSGEIDRVRDVFDILVDAALAGAIFGIVTTLQNYENFAISNFTVPRDAGSGNALNCSIELQEIRTVETQTVMAIPSKAEKTHRGPKAPKQAEATEAQEAVSVADKIATSLGFTVP